MGYQTQGSYRSISSSGVDVVSLSWPNPVAGTEEGQWGIEGGLLPYRWTEVATDVFTWVPQPVLNLGTPVARIGPLLGTEDSVEDWEAAGADTTVLSIGAGAGASGALSAANGYARVNVRASNTGNGSNCSFYNSEALTSATSYWGSVEVDIATLDSTSVVYIAFASQSDSPFRALRLGRVANVANIELLSMTGETVITADAALATGARNHVVFVQDATTIRVWMNGKLCLYSNQRSSYPVTVSYPRLGPYVGTSTSTGNTGNVGFGAGSVWGIIT